MIKLVVFDIDGVLTDGSCNINSDLTFSKRFLFKDVDSFNKIKQLGIKTMLLTGEKDVFSDFFHSKFNPDYFHDGVKDKHKFLQDFLKEIQITYDEVCYVGDGKKDIDCMKNSTLSICPSNAINEVKEISTCILETSGGCGVVDDVYHLLVSKLHYNINTITTMENIFDQHIYICNKLKFDKVFQSNIEKAVSMLIQAIENKKKILACGNGGSAADSQHFVTELVGKFLHERPALSAISLNCNTSIITAIGNDDHFDNIFSRQIDGLGETGDILFAITTSDGSNDISRAVDNAIQKGLKVILLTSEKSKRVGNSNMLIIKVPTSETPTIQEFHIMIIHYLCYFIEQKMIGE